MNLYTCTDHDGHWPVGVASIVIAENKEEAKELLKSELSKQGLDTHNFTLNKVDLDKKQAIILFNGDY